MIGYAIRQQPPPRPTRISLTHAQRTRAIVERFATGERYVDLARTFGMPMHQVIRLVHRYARHAAPDQYWHLLKAYGHRLFLPHAVLREHLQTLLTYEGTDGVG